MIRGLYSLAMYLAQPLLRRKLAKRGEKEVGYLHAVDERFGRYVAGGAQPNPAEPWIWIHAVSLGETRAAAVLIAALRTHIPHMRLLLTHGTATGRAEGKTLLREGDVQVWQPWDAPGAVNLFLDQFQPCVGVLMETEVWPNLSAACQARGIALLLVNARLSEKSLAAALRMSWLARPAYAALTAVYAQTDIHAQRFLQLGAKVDGVFGNLKFDAEPPPALLAQGAAWKAAWCHMSEARPMDQVKALTQTQTHAEVQPEARPHTLPNTQTQTQNQLATEVATERVTRPMTKAIVLFAVSREGEEILFLQQICALPPAQRIGLQFMIVPRHPQRFDEVANLILAQGLRLSRRRAWSALGPISNAEGAGQETNAGVMEKKTVEKTMNAGGRDATPGTSSTAYDCIWLGDSLGEMPLYYALSDVALLGGSYLPLGGQNLIEAAACACPVVMGPHTFNFAEAAQNSVSAGAGFEVPDMAAAFAKLNDLLNHPAQLAQAKHAAQQFVAQHRGAAQKTAQAVLRHLHGNAGNAGNAADTDYTGNTSNSVAADNFANVAEAGKAKHARKAGKAGKTGNAGNAGNVGNAGNSADAANAIHVGNTGIADRGRDPAAWAMS